VRSLVCNTRCPSLPPSPPHPTPPRPPKPPPACHAHGRLRPRAQSLH
jgi:hypothetical protein